MECKCGADISTTKEYMDSEKAKKAFPNRSIPSGWKKIHVVHRMCKCTRYHADFHLIEKGAPTLSQPTLF